jgi:hypothetical protein
MWLTSIDSPACWLDMMEAVDDVEIQDITSQTRSFLEHIDDDRIDPCIGDHQM